jgi:hypothetical protein
VIRQAQKNLSPNQVASPSCAYVRDAHIAVAGGLADCGTDCHAARDTQLSGDINLTWTKPVKKYSTSEDIVVSVEVRADMKRIIEHLLFDAPDPRRIASLPVDWIASTMAEGGAARHPS